MEFLEHRLKESWQIRRKNFAPEICCTYPRKTKAVSVTGHQCSLNCSHCGGHYLQHMIPLHDVVTRDLDAASYLISGGCDPSGKVPIAQHVGLLKQLSMHKRLNLHVGLVDPEDIEVISQVADQVSFDFIADSETIREVLGLTKTSDDYIACYRNLRAQCSVIPHICIGLRGGKISGEYRALDLLQKIGAERLTFIVFTPTPGTQFADRQPPEIHDVLEVLIEARKKFPGVPLSLGCMRPGGSYRRQLDPLAVRIGINCIVNPVPEAVRVAQTLGLAVVNREECCVF